MHGIMFKLGMLRSVIIPTLPRMCTVAGWMRKPSAAVR
jgi:hypothetical protein